MSMAMTGATSESMAHAAALSGPQGRKPKRLIDPARILIYTVLILAAIFYLFPLYIMVITSLKDLEGIRYGNLFVPTDASDARCLVQGMGHGAVPGSTAKASRSAS